MITWPASHALRLLTLSLLTAFAGCGDSTAQSSPTPTEAVARTVSVRAENRPPSISVLVIGDSLTVGGFGEALQSYLTARYGRAGVVLIGSCGSSPENWLREEPTYYTKCGFRAQAPQGSVYRDFENGHAPPRTATPKVEALVSVYHPASAVIQLGTNWMDPIVAHGFDEEKYRLIIHRFVAALRSSEPGLHIVWITPPDHSRYSPRVKQEVNTLIRSSARSENYEIIDSTKLTHYVAGETGGDGVHYRNKEAQEWAARVTQLLNSRLPRR